MSLPKLRPLLPWFIWLALFYACWLALVIAGNHWHTLAAHKGIAIAMALGSYAAEIGRAHV